MERGIQKLRSQERRQGILVRREQVRKTMGNSRKDFVGGRFEEMEPRGIEEQCRMGLLHDESI
jgi:hypothetical protein